MTAARLPCEKRTESFENSRYSYRRYLYCMYITSYLTVDTVICFELAANLPLGASLQPSRTPPPSPIPHRRPSLPSYPHWTQLSHNTPAETGSQFAGTLHRRCFPTFWHFLSRPQLVQQVVFVPIRTQNQAPASRRNYRVLACLSVCLCSINCAGAGTQKRPGPGHRIIRQTRRISSHPKGPTLFDQPRKPSQSATVPSDPRRGNRYMILQPREKKNSLRNETSTA
ncbi:hypothetical protein B0T17DRAFT_116178 [Bombardia bombarda]|uniref:Uncharacterized protein n=1 Tax=Bombardia bombarda TaxID=252184 RepID=A0AA39WAL7_9PEZI|nr:hypothetical protein B0T17DRAFT_116178 [Bombardia bombarda]